jgi:hypothetical protein
MTSLAAALDLLPRDWIRRPPATQVALYQDSLALTKNLPKDFWKFLSISDGGEGKVNAVYLSFWTLQEIRTLNGEYGFQERMHPDLCVIGTTDDAFVAHDFREKTEQWVVFPFGDFDLDEVCAISFTFVDLITAFVMSNFSDRVTKLLK